MSWLTDRLGIKNGKIQISIGMSTRQKEELLTRELAAQRLAEQEALKLGYSKEDAIQIGNAAYQIIRNQSRTYADKQIKESLSKYGNTAAAILAAAGTVVSAIPGPGTVIGAAMLAGSAASAAGAKYSSNELERRKNAESAYSEFQKQKALIVSTDMQGGNTAWVEAENEINKLKAEQEAIANQYESGKIDENIARNKVNELENKIQSLINKIKTLYPETNQTYMPIKGNPIKNETKQEQETARTKDVQKNNSIETEGKTAPPGFWVKLKNFWKNLFKK